MYLITKKLFIPKHIPLQSCNRNWSRRKHVYRQDNPGHQAPSLLGQEMIEEQERQKDTQVSDSHNENTHQFKWLSTVHHTANNNNSKVYIVYFWVIPCNGFKDTSNTGQWL